MAGKPKPGLDYAGWSTNIFDGDTKIDRLLEAQGWIGFSIYFYLCQMAYKFDGYFYRWSYADAPTTARRMGGGIKSETVKAAVGACLQIGLFDKRLFEENAILTSRGIQKRFYAAKKEKRRKAVISDYWLLGKNDEPEGLEECAEFEDDCGKDGDSCYKDGDDCSKDGPKRKVKESKEKESKRKENGSASDNDNAVFIAYQEKIGGKLTGRIRDELMAFVRAMGTECCVRAMDMAIEANKLSWNYVRSVLKSKQEKGVRDIEGWDASEKRWKESHSGKSDVGDAAGDRPAYTRRLEGVIEL